MVVMVLMIVPIPPFPILTKGKFDPGTEGTSPSATGLGVGEGPPELPQVLPGQIRERAEVQGFHVQARDILRES